jgi:hypothetical protein
LGAAVFRWINAVESGRGGIRRKYPSPVMVTV